MKYEEIDDEEYNIWRDRVLELLGMTRNQSTLFIPGFSIVVDDEMRECVNGIERWLQWYANGEKPPQEVEK